MPLPSSPPSVRVRLAFSAGALALLATGLPGGYLAWHAASRLRAQAHEDMALLARGLAREAEDQLGRAISAMEEVAKRREIGRGGIAAKRALELVARPDGALDSLAVVDRDGAVQAEARAAEDSPALPPARLRRAYAREAGAHPGLVIHSLRREAATLVLELHTRLRGGALLLGALRLDSGSLGVLE